MKKPIAQYTLYDDKTYEVISKDSVVQATAGEPSVNGEPISQMSEVAKMILGIKDGPNTAVDNNQNAGAPSPEVSYNTDGETMIGNKGRVFVTGCKGNSDFDLGPVAAGVQKTIALVASGPGDCSGDFQVVDRNGTPLTAVYNGTDPSLTFIGTGIDAVIHVRLSKPLARMAVVWQN